MANPYAPNPIDDDQRFIDETVGFVVNHDSVNYLAGETITDPTDRIKVIELELFTGDRFKITIEEL